MTYGDKYKSYTYAAYYVGKHEKGMGRRLSTWRERRVVAAALRALGPVTTVLDIPSGTGRFLPVLAQFRMHVIASDLSTEMLQAGHIHYDRFVHPPRPVVASAFQIPMADESVDAALCSRLVHHFALPEQRIAVMRELARICRVGAVVTFFDAASLKHRRRLRRRMRRGKVGNRHAVTRREFADEAEEAGLSCVSMHALLRFHSELTAAALVKRDDQ
ncbi:MAG: class I SAM-dependent methyltransferase [Phycisphaerae bacterium]|nr:class I SAM-dependent methyltransferase [Phycisphaerae bacterium]